jgi:membrane protease YdiL (CAAX protease family)
MAASGASTVRRQQAAVPKVQIHSWRMVIAGTFLAALVVQLSLATLVSSRGLINPEDYAPLVVGVLTIYAAPFGVMLGGFFAAKGNSRKAPAGLVWGILVLSSVWNGLLLIRFLMFAFSMTDGDLGHLKAFQETVVPAGNFLIAGALTYLFGAHSTS